MADDEYELIPHKEISELRKEIQNLKEQIKGKPDSNGASEKTLLEAINELIAVFREATEEIRAKPGTIDKFSILAEQNEKIARGILALADIMTERLPSLNKYYADIKTSEPAPQQKVEFRHTEPENEFGKRRFRSIQGFDENQPY
ncbi:MAG: hypothetical protein NTV63_03160 [Candidatus Woesearchaeota archaeon]|nr:hypothetical protein [Candidatus Woesearchaeota archaeon]